MKPFRSGADIIHGTLCTLSSSIRVWWRGAKGFFAPLGVRKQMWKGWKAPDRAPWSLFRRDNCRVSVWLQRLQFVRILVHVAARQTTSTLSRLTSKAQLRESFVRWNYTAGLCPPSSFVSALEGDGFIGYPRERSPLPLHSQQPD